MKRLGPLKSIRKFCLECAGTYKEVELCTSNPTDIKKADLAGDEIPYLGCPLYEFRLDITPAVQRSGAVERLRNPKISLDSRG